MTKTRSRWFGPREAGQGREPQGQPAQDTAPLTPIAPTGVARCLRACAEHGAAADTDTAPGTASDTGSARAALASALLGLPTPEEAAPRERADSEGSTGPESSGSDAGCAEALSAELLDALLDVGGKALECGPEEWKLAVLVSDTVLTHRGESRAGWRLRGRALEAVGDGAGAVDAYTRYLARTDHDTFGVAARITGLEAALPLQRELVRLLDHLAPATTEAGRTGHPVLDMEAEAERYIERHLAADDTDASSDHGPDSRPEGPEDSEGSDPARLSEVIGLYADQRRHRLRPPLPDPTLDGVGWLSLGEFRNLIAGRSLCLVANSPTVGDSSLGAQIDSYDLVVRFNSYRIEPAATGERTDIHATGHRHTHNWEQPVDTRLVFCGESADWRHAVRNRLVPGAQQRVGDESLRWPVRNVGRMHADTWPPVPTAGFNTMWLIDFLDVSPRFDLIGFDFFGTGAYRLPAAMRIPVPTASQYAGEKAWIMERAQHVNGPVISLR